MPGCTHSRASRVAARELPPCALNELPHAKPSSSGAAAAAISSAEIARRISGSYSREIASRHSLNVPLSSRPCAKGDVARMGEEHLGLHATVHATVHPTVHACT